MNSGTRPAWPSTWKGFRISSRKKVPSGPSFQHPSRKDDQPSKKIRDLDYECYDSGEARLGWVNVQIDLIPVESDEDRRPPLVDGNKWLMALSLEIHRKLKRRRVEIAHLKLTLQATDRVSCSNSIAAVPLVRTTRKPEFSTKMERVTEGGKFLVNLRAEASPDTLIAAVMGALSARWENDKHFRMEGLKSASFRPGKPVPTHRICHV